VRRAKWRIVYEYMHIPRGPSDASKTTAENPLLPRAGTKIEKVRSAWRSPRSKGRQDEFTSADESKARAACGEKGVDGGTSEVYPGVRLSSFGCQGRRHRPGTVRCVVAVAWPPPALPCYLSGERSTCESGLDPQPQPSARFVCPPQPRSSKNRGGHEARSFSRSTI